MSVDMIEMIWFLASAIAFAFSLVNAREAYLDMRVADGARPAISLVARSRMITEILRAVMMGVSVVMSTFVYLYPNPAKVHVPLPFETAILITLLAFVFGTGATTLVSRRQRDILSHHLEATGNESA